MEDFIANNSVWILIIIGALAYPIKKLFNYLFARYGVSSAVTDAVTDGVTEFAQDEVAKIKAKHDAKLNRTVTRADGSEVTINQNGFRIKQPSNPNNDVNNGENNEKAKETASDTDTTDDPDRSK